MTLQPGPLSPGMIVSRSDIQCGEPCIAGTRVPARAIKDFHRAGYTIAQIHREYPGLTDEQLEAAIAFDGWITAPPGGWGSNPVPGRRVEVLIRSVGPSEGLSDDFDWEHLADDPDQDIIALRLVDEATGESGSSAKADTHRTAEGAVVALKLARDMLAAGSDRALIIGHLDDAINAAARAKEAGE